MKRIFEIAQANFENFQKLPKWNFLPMQENQKFLGQIYSLFMWIKVAKSG